MNTRDKRLKNEHQNMLRLPELSSYIEVYPSSDSDTPNEYHVVFNVTSMTGPDSTGDRHVVNIYLDSGYPHHPPVVTVLSPVFHPNIASPMQNTKLQNELMAQFDHLHDPRQRMEALRRLVNNPENFRASVCLDILELNWAMELPLSAVCIEVGEMLQYKRLNAAHPLNHEAAAWARQNAPSLPLDRHNLLDKMVAQKLSLYPEAPLTDEIILLDEDFAEG
jgi:ubiquitin-protein ligase